MSEPADAACILATQRRRKFLNHAQLDRRNGDNNELRDSFAALDVERLRRIGVDERHEHLTAIAAVDEAGRVHHGYPMTGGQTTSGQHQAGEAERDRNGHAGRYDASTAAWREAYRFTGTQVEPGVARLRVCRKRKFGVDCHDGDFDGVATVRHVGHRRRVATCPCVWCAPGVRARATGPGNVAAMLAWMDLEMTGLEPARHVIVEIATIITDDDLTIVAEGPDLVLHAADDALALMDEVVVNMHTRSGLLDAIKSSTTTLAEATEQTMDFLRAHIPEPRSIPLCGNSIGTDRRFLAQWMPEIDDYLHYRSVDVSTVKELSRRWYPTAVKNAPRKAGGHRALDDIRESIEELRYYRQAVFLPTA